ncbi:MAG: hypothetical protein CMB80_01070 [Flammeovirgaceae bacterium]|nr:hypothetical protein [Flammeovirgaceae bacterium]|tara:strand:+ start:252 stop:461 length:210 start_codon:yes stop_codon:yes gene_type:complete
MRTFFAVLFVVALYSVAGCSAEALVRGDLFYKKNEEPRTTMPGYGSVGGQSNANTWMVGIDKFPKMKGD